MRNPNFVQTGIDGAWSAITLRDLVAKDVLAGFAANHDINWSGREAAKEAVEWADALLTELERHG